MFYSLFYFRIVKPIWYRQKYLALLLFPFEIIYRVCIFLRKKNCKPVFFSVPVIVVGNITVGGGGKSPFVIALSAYLTSIGYKPGIISRGYGRQVKSHAPLDVHPQDDPINVGDEPRMIAEQTRSPVIVGSDRVCSAQYLLEKYPDCNVIISDDGLQHYRLGRTCSICLLNGEKQLGNKHCLPAGPLREPLSALSSYDIVIDRQKDASLLKTHYEGFVQVREELCVRPLDFFENQTVHVVTGIAYPESFLEKLKTLGMTCIPHLFPDHYFFSEEDISFNDDLPVVMTQKDAVKCQIFAKQNTWFLKMRFELTPLLQQRICHFLEMP